MESNKTISLIPEHRKASSSSSSIQKRFPPIASSTPSYSSSVSSSSDPPPRTIATSIATPEKRSQLRIIAKLPRLKRQKSTNVSASNKLHSTMASCTLGGHLDSPTDLRSVLGTMISDPQLHSLCDVVLIVQDERFMAHRAVLAAASCVFKAMFTNCMKERDAPEITLSSVDKRAWRMVMQYIYNAQVDLDSDEDALVLLSTARMYQLERLERFVETFLGGRVGIANTLRLLDVAERYELQQLQGVCFATMEREFEGLALSPAFLCCPVHVVTQWLSSKQLVLKSEMMVFEAIARWISTDTQRNSHLEKLLNLINLDRLSDAEVKEVAQHRQVEGCWRFRERIFERLISSSADIMTERALKSRTHLKTRRRDANVFTFAHTQRGMTKMQHPDEEEVVRTPWSMDSSGKHVWRLKIYPSGYSRARGQYLSMYVQGRSTNKSKPLDVSAKFDIFLVNQKEEGTVVTFSSQHHFQEKSDHWGFHRFLQLSQLVNSNLGYVDEASDSVVVGANLYFT